MLRGAKRRAAAKKSSLGSPGPVEARTVSVLGKILAIPVVCVPLATSYIMFRDRSDPLRGDGDARHGRPGGRRDEPRRTAAGRRDGPARLAGGAREAEEEGAIRVIARGNRQGDTLPTFNSSRAPADDILKTG